MRQLAQKLRLRSAAFELPRPKPDLIGQQLRDAPLLHTIEHKERTISGTRHQGLAGNPVGADDSEPAAPARRTRARIGACQIACYGMCCALRRDRRLES